MYKSGYWIPDNSKKNNVWKTTPEDDEDFSETPKKKRKCTVGRNKVESGLSDTSESAENPLNESGPMTDEDIRIEEICNDWLLFVEHALTQKYREPSAN